jgi:hypothetical protein
MTNRAHSVWGAEVRLEMTIPIEIKPEARQLADRLVALEDEAQTIAPEDRLAMCRVCEKLRRPLCNLVGGLGFRSLLQRALTLAQR